MVLSTVCLEILAERQVHHLWIIIIIFNKTAGDNFTKLLPLHNNDTLSFNFQSYVSHFFFRPHWQHPWIPISTNSLLGNFIFPLVLLKFPSDSNHYPFSKPLFRYLSSSIPLLEPKTCISFHCCFLIRRINWGTITFPLSCLLQAFSFLRLWDPWPLNVFKAIKAGERERDYFSWVPRYSGTKTKTLLLCSVWMSEHNLNGCFIPLSLGLNCKAAIVTGTIFISPILVF